MAVSLEKDLWFGQTLGGTLQGTWGALGGAQSPGGKMALLKAPVPSGRGVGAVDKEISSCSGIPAVGIIKDFSFFINKHYSFEETRGSIIHYFLLT